jgi:SAM-dependent methyltransferase
MSKTAAGSAAAQYAARVDAVLAQRTRLRGPQPPGDLFAGLPASNPLLTSDPHRALDPGLELIASYVEPEDIIVDVGGGAGRVSLPLALRCREVINVETSAVMGAAFSANANRAGIGNTRVITSDWPLVDAPLGTFALVNSVTYLTRDIVPFITKLEQSGRRRVLITVNSPPTPSAYRDIYELVHGEVEEVVPGHVELVNVLWEMGILPDIRVLPPFVRNMPWPSRESAIAGAVARFGADQWSLWPLGTELEQRVRRVLTERFDELYAPVPDGFLPRWFAPNHEILITWQPQI